MPEFFIPPLLILGGAAIALLLMGFSQSRPARLKALMRESSGMLVFAALILYFVAHDQSQDAFFWTLVVTSVSAFFGEALNMFQRYNGSQATLGKLWFAVGALSVLGIFIRL